MTNYFPDTIRTHEDMELPWPEGTTAIDDDGDALEFSDGRWRYKGNAMRGSTLPYTDVHLPEGSADRLLTEQGIELPTADEQVESAAARLSEAVRGASLNALVTVGGVAMTARQYNAVRESLEASLAVEPASYPLPVFGPDATAEDIADSIPAEHVQDVATLLNARAREQEDIARSHMLSKEAADLLLEHLGMKVRLTPADKQRLRDAIDAHETENRA